MMELSKGYDLKTDDDMVNLRVMKNHIPIYATLKRRPCIFSAANYKRCIDFFLIFQYIYLFHFAILEAEGKWDSEICYAKHGVWVHMCKEIGLHKGKELKTGGKSNEKDISDISNFNFLIMLFSSESK